MWTVANQYNTRRDRRSKYDFDTYLVSDNYIFT